MTEYSRFNREVRDLLRARCDGQGIKPKPTTRSPVFSFLLPTEKVKAKDKASMAKQSSNARKRARKKALQDQAHLKKREEEKKNESKGSEKPKKNKNNKRKEEDREEDDHLLAFAQAWASNSSGVSTTKEKKSDTQKKKKPKQQHHQNTDRKPLAFPSQGLPLPTDGFLRDEDPYRESFRVALETSYEGLAWEGPNRSLDEEMNQALAVMDEHRLFRTDVTQPAGLGAKLVPSYVTRCLLGDEGTTYRYLGLRMFSHPWNGSGQGSEPQLQESLQAFQSLNDRLSKQTKGHLQDLKKQRQSRQEQEPQGQSTFNVTLINRMTVHKRLREEPMFGTNKYSVGWHADSSLEHFSTIAVYHTLVTDLERQPTHKKKRKKFHASSANEEEWAVALRVTHDAEGPKAKRLGDITVETNAPPIAVALPSGSTYYLLDDYNHHHQHAVLAPTVSSSVSTIRYSSTHRLLRQGHKVQDMLAKCQKALADDHHGPKRWRSEQVLLNELENEWLRQFFIQGADHKELLWGYWKNPIQELFRYWEKLEARTLQVLQLLHKACLQRCKKDPPKDGPEALATVRKVLGDRKNGFDGIYKPVANLIRERGKSRELWKRREHDSVFKKLPEDCRPVPFPVAFGKQDDAQGAMATSRLPKGSGAFLKALSGNVEEWGRAFDSGNGNNVRTSVLA